MPSGIATAPGLIEPGWSAGRAAIVWDIRLPRALLGALVGAGLALVGAVLQSVTRNPLADPHLLGICPGGTFGAILPLLHTGVFLGPVTVPVMAFLGALAATGIVLTLANALIFLGDLRASHTVVFWMLGGLGLAQWSYLLFPAAVLLVAGAWLRRVAPSLNAMTIGDESAATLGIPVARFRLAVLVAGALVTGVMVVYSGVIGFVGLMIPHIVRLLVGGDAARVVPVSMLTGAIFLIWGDIAARTLMRPEDVPLGAITGLVGGGFFMWLLRQRSGRSEGAPVRYNPDVDCGCRNDRDSVAEWRISDLFFVML